jgi:hypothetical protein
VDTIEMSENLTKKNVEEHLKRLWYVIVDLNISIKNAKKIHQYNQKENSVAKSDFVLHHFEQLKFIIVIQLHKVIFPDEKSSILKLCNSKYDQSFSSLLTENRTKSGDLFSSLKDFKGFKDKYEAGLQQFEKQITKVKDLRDGYYAHYDDKQLLGISFQELEDLIGYCTQMYKELVKKLHNRKDMVERVGNWDIEYVLKRLELANKLEMEKLGIVCSQDSGKEV